MKKISVIINNYNYGRFLHKSIESVLQQTVPPHEIIVVDDGSTDDSVAIAKGFGSSILLIQKANGGQASAFNAGFAAASGDWIWFVDADDWLQSDAIERVSLSIDPSVVKIHAPLTAVISEAVHTGATIPAYELSSGNVINEIIETGAYRWPPTTGNVFARNSLLPCMPVPETAYRLCADLYICSCIAMKGPVKALTSPLGFYRMHGGNHFHGFRLEPRWLASQATNILLSAALTAALVRAHTAHKNYEYIFERRNLEMLMIAKRFTDLPEVKKLSKRFLTKKWYESAGVKNLEAKARVTAIAFWTILSYAPRSVVKYVVYKGIEKGKKSQLEK